MPLQIERASDKGGQVVAALPLWDVDFASICDSIRAGRGRMRILLKTRNESDFLLDWIDYHARIVGRQNLIIADNMSDDPGAQEALRVAARDSIVFQFGGFHNTIHDRDKFPRLYDAVRSSCRFFMFMDADERLAWVEDDIWISDSRLIDRVEARMPFDLLPGLLIDNFAGRRDAFFYSNLPEVEVEFLKWGKPIIGCSAGIPGGDKIHNCQFSSELFARQMASLNLVSLHLTRLDPHQRLHANHRKLIARGSVSPEMSLEEIAELDESMFVDGVSDRCVEEIRDILGVLKGDENASWGPSDLRQSILFRLDGSMAYGSHAAHEGFRMFVAGGGARYVSMIFPELPEQGESLPCIDDIKEMIAAGEIESARRLLRESMAKYPNQLDSYGDPVFRKELIRLTLAQGGWEEAVALVQESDGVGRNGWHHILFARAYEKSEQRQNALKAWEAVLTAFPGQPEALAGVARISAEELSPSGSATLAPLEPRMSAAECALFEKTLDGVRFLLEFGAGGSTSFAARRGVGHIVSVESDVQWLNLLAQRPEMQAIHFVAFHVDVGPTGDWGTPTDPAAALSWPAYYRNVWKKLDEQHEPRPDLVLVDGRFRVACTLATILHCGHDVTIAIHDFWDRPHYHGVLAYLECIDQVDTLGVFRPRAEIEWKQLAMDLVDYTLDVR